MMQIEGEMITSIGHSVAETALSIRAEVRRIRRSRIWTEAGYARFAPVLPSPRGPRGVERASSMFAHVMGRLPPGIFARRAPLGLLVAEDAFGFLDRVEERAPALVSGEWRQLREGWSHFGDRVLATLVGAGARVSPEHVATIREGHPSALAALTTARGWLDEGKVEAVILVAASSSCDPCMLELWSGLGIERDGAIPSEACAIAVVRRAEVEAPRLAPAGLAKEPSPTTLTTTGDGLSSAWRAALEGAHVQGPLEILTDHNGERWRAKELTVAMARALAPLNVESELLHVPMWTGDLGAAFGLCALLLAVHETRDDRRPRIVSASTRGPGRAAVFIAPV